MVTSYHDTQGDNDMKQNLVFKMEVTSTESIKLTSFLEYTPMSTEYYHGEFDNLTDIIWSIQARREKLLDAGISLV
jgi:hypothetical protein